MAQANKVAAMPAPEVTKTTDPFAGLTERLTQKRQAFDMAQTAIADAISLEAMGEAAIGKVEAAQGNVTNILAKGMIAGFFVKDEVSAILGDAYGFNPKEDGTPGKTPSGSGGSIRKRVVLLDEATRITNGEVKEDAFPRWAKGKSALEIAPFVNEWLAGERSPSDTYKKLTTKKKAPTVDLPYNEKRLLEIAEALMNPETRERIAGNPALVAAYDAIAAAWASDPLAF